LQAIRLWLSLNFVQSYSKPSLERFIEHGAIADLKETTGGGKERRRYPCKEESTSLKQKNGGLVRDRAAGEVKEMNRNTIHKQYAHVSQPSPDYAQLLQGGDKENCRLVVEAHSALRRSAKELCDPCDEGGFIGYVSWLVSYADVTELIVMG
jgi:hypothetical protein